MFYRKMVKENGKKYMEDLEKEKIILVPRAYDHYEKLLNEYRELND